MTTSIVCGIDGSTHARAAMPVAAALSERLERRLVLVHAVPATVPDLQLAAPAHAPFHVERIDLVGHDAGEALLLEAVEVLDLPGIEWRLETGVAAERITAIAAQEQAELVVVGSRGAGALSGAIFGSVSAAVVRDATCPVVVVPAAAVGSPLEGLKGSA